MEKIDFNEAELIVSKATLPTITLRGIVAFPSTVESFELIRKYGNLYGILCNY